jgi:hypothetical protein
MFSSLEYTAFLWKAKGRHGTHSPFAYWLVDQISGQKTITLRSEIANIESKKTRLFLAKLLHILPNYALYTIEDLIPKQCDKNFEVGIYVFSCQQMSAYIDEGQIELTHPDSIFIIWDHRKKGNKAHWQHTCNSTFLHFSADCYHFGLVSLKPGQAKQHFYLKLA